MRNGKRADAVDARTGNAVGVSRVNSDGRGKRANLRKLFLVLLMLACAVVQAGLSRAQGAKPDSLCCGPPPKTYITPTLTLSTSLSPSAYGTSVVFTASLSPSVCQGTTTITFYDSGASIGAATWSGSAAQLSNSTLSVGTQTISASYPGYSVGNDVCYSVSSNTVSQVVNPVTPTISVNSSPNPSIPGSTVTLTATVTSGDTNTVTFYSNGVSLGTATPSPSGGTATLTTSSLPVGSDSITANIAAAGNYLANTSGAISQVVSGTTPTISVASASNPSTYGSPVTFTANVTPGDTNTVTFFYNVSTSLGTATPNSSGTATLTTSSLPVGSDSITAIIAGGGIYGTANSSAFTQVVSNGTPTITGILPNPAPVGSTVVVYGTSFGPPNISSTISFNGVIATPTSWEGTSIAVPVPVNATTGSVVVTVGGAPSNSFAFTVSASCGP